MKKNQEYIVDIIDNGFEGEGIAKIDDFTIFIPQTLKGERVKIVIVKVKSSYAFGKALEIINKSRNRVEEDCSTYKRCGGCNLRYMDYENTLNLKREMVKNCLKKELKYDIEVYPTIGMGNPYNYRNKLQYPVGLNKNREPVMGVYANRTHDIIPTNQCLIQNTKAQEIANDTFEFLVKNDVRAYNEQTRKGVLRHIVIRVGVHTDEIMLILVVNQEKIDCEENFISYITKKHPEIKTIVKNLNKKDTNVILGVENKIIYGPGYIYDELGDYKFKISPLSFYQVNPIQTEMLYNTAMDYAELTGKETVLDLYCGIGTIGIFAAKKAKKVYGIEIIENAIKDAKENARINKVDNTEFFVGDVEQFLPVLMQKEKLMPDVIFVDPPRKGCDSKTIKNLLLLEAKKIVYVSCNSATLARDVKLLEEKYEIKKVQPVDMFPFTRTLRSCNKFEVERIKNLKYNNEEVQYE